jgi:hypothetical protein
MAKRISGRRADKTKAGGETFGSLSRNGKARSINAEIMGVKKDILGSFKDCKDPNQLQELKDKRVQSLEKIILAIKAYS